MKKSLLSLLALAFLCSEARAADLMVDQNDPACSDAVGAPFCSISGGVGNALDGDRVIVAAGTYFEALFISRDITVRGAGTGVTVVDGGPLATFDLSGDVALEDMTITGAKGRGVVTSGLVQITDCEITGNSGAGGGGIFQEDGVLDIRRTVISDNTSNFLNIAGGAGVWTREGDLTMIDSFLVDNHNLHSGSPGGGLKFDGGDALIIRTTISGNTSQNNYGGLSSIGASLTLIDCVVENNEAAGSPGGVGSLGSDLTLINTTVSGNRAQFTAGVLLGGCCGGSLTMRNVTVSGNTSSSFSSTGGVFSGATSAISNSLIAGNFNASGANDCGGTLTSEGYNLIQSATCPIDGDTTGNVIGLNPGLLPLADNGGPTWTHGLAADSPARDAGNPAAAGSSDAACPASDQRGVPRPQDGDGVDGERCDIGALEAADLLLGDGFESGDTSAWSLTVP